MDLKQEWALLTECLVATASEEQDANGQFPTNAQREIYYFLKAFQAKLLDGYYDQTMVIGNTLAKESRRTRLTQGCIDPGFLLV